MKKILLTLSLLVFVLLSCGNSKNADNSKTLILNAREEGKSYDPQLANDATGEFVDTLIGDGLTRDNPNGKADPGIAEKWEVSEDGLTWTFHLRDAKWSNGDPITANDFKAAWLRGLNPETASEYAFMLYYIKNGEKYNKGEANAEDVAINVIDDRTLEVTLEAPTTYFDTLVAYATYLPFNQKFYDTVKEKYMTTPETSISSGPYVIKSWTRDAEIVFEKNENYWNKDKFKIDVVQYKFISDNAAALAAFKNGEVDTTTITVEQAKEFENDPRTTLKADGSVWYTIFNLKNPVLANKKIREALTLAIDRDELVTGILNNKGVVANTYTTKNIGIYGVEKDFTEEAGDVFPKYNPEKAKSLLAEGLKELNLEKLPEFELIFNDSGNNKVISEYIQESLKKNLNVDIKIQAMTFQERLARMEQRNFDLVLAGYAGAFLDAITYLDRFESTNGNNYSQYVNPRYDELVKIAKTSPDQKVRVDAMIEMEKIIAQDFPVGLLYYRQNTRLTNPRVKNLQTNSIGQRLIIDNTYID